jgi:HIP---CoA ligase
LDAPVTLPHLAFDAARRFGAKTAIRTESGAVLSYGELGEAVSQAAAAFIAHGVARGDRVAVWAPNSAEWIVAALVLQAAGAALVPLNTRLKGREAGYILRSSGARLLLTVSSFLGVAYPALLAEERLPDLEGVVLLDGGQGGTPWAEFLAAGEASRSAVERRLQSLSGEDLSDILFTSGTTGQPKGAQTTHAQNLRLFRMYAGRLGLRPDDRYLIVNPFFHSFGYKAGWLSCLIAGAAIHPHAVFDAKAVLRRVAEERITVLPGPPTLYQSLLAEDFGAYDLSTLRVAITGAASVPVELVRRMRTDLGIDVVLTAYGLTETCGVVTMCEPCDSLETIARTAGKVVEGLELKLVDADGRPVAPGEPGEVLVRGYCVMKGYFDNPEETRKAIDAEGWLHTGDVAVQDARGYLAITDRKKDMFIVGGFNCYPAEIENLLLGHPAILQAAVVGMPHVRMGEVAKAFVVLRPGASAAPGEIIAWARENMANYKAPRFVEIVDALPLNASGKVQRFLLRERALAAL